MDEADLQGLVATISNLIEKIMEEGDAYPDDNPDNALRLIQQLKKTLTGLSRGTIKQIISQLPSSHADFMKGYLARG